MFRRLVVYPAALASGIASARWVTGDEVQRRKWKSQIESATRVSRLVRVASRIVFEYKVVSPIEDIATWVRKRQSPEHQRVRDLRAYVRKCQDHEEVLGRKLVNMIAKGVTNSEELEDTKVALAAVHEEVRKGTDELDLLEQSLASSDSETCHARGAQMLLDLCKTNGGTFVKLGQHVSQLDYLVPVEYTSTLAQLLDDAPQSSFESVATVIQEELGASPEQLWNNFDPKPIASASLGQVHVAYDKTTNEKLAVKVQHRDIARNVEGDIYAVGVVIDVLSKVFPDFGARFKWLVDDLASVVRKELDFTVEANNCKESAERFKDWNQVVVPTVSDQYSTQRVLTMSFEEGVSVTDVNNLERNGINKAEVVELVSRVFNTMVFEHGFVHCDPHPANVLVAIAKHKHGGESWWQRLFSWFRWGSSHNQFKLVLLDHGQYKRLPDDFRITYAQLWKSMIFGDTEKIKQYSILFGAPDDDYPLLAAMITNRPWLEISSETGSGGLRAVSAGVSKSDQRRIRMYAEKYAVQIASMLSKVSRDLILVFKMLDSIRFIERSLGSPINSFIVAGMVSIQALHHRAQEQYRLGSIGVLEYILAWCSHSIALFRLQMARLLQ